MFSDKTLHQFMLHIVCILPKWWRSSWRFLLMLSHLNQNKGTDLGDEILVHHKNEIKEINDESSRKM